MQQRCVAVLAVVILLIGLAACSGGSSTKTDVTIEDFVFTSAPAAAGSTVTVSNKDPMTHTVTADHGAFSVTVNSRSTATFTAPAKPGTYTFHCNIHPTMHGTLTVN